jgi:hypothetical protein
VNRADAVPLVACGKDEHELLVPARGRGRVAQERVVRLAVGVVSVDALRAPRVGADPRSRPVGGAEPHGGRLEEVGIARIVEDLGRADLDERADPEPVVVEVGVLHGRPREGVVSRDHRRDEIAVSISAVRERVGRVVVHVDEAAQASRPEHLELVVDVGDGASIDARVGHVHHEPELARLREALRSEPGEIAGPRRGDVVDAETAGDDLTLGLVIRADDA